MKPVILFDLGQTLVDYFTREAFPPLVEAGIAAAAHIIGRDVSRERVMAEDFEASDGIVRPLEERLTRIFGACDPVTLKRASAAFTACLIAPGRLYGDTLSTLDELRRRGHRMGIVSNMPWGTPSEPWAEDMARRGVSAFMEHIVFCHDVGWRKPDSRIFAEALRRFDCAPAEALFVGDRPDWDIRGAREAGLEAVLLDRHDVYPKEPRITGLTGLFAWLE